jgi:hypothetical protein
MILGLNTGPTLYGLGLVSNDLVYMHNIPALEAHPFSLENSLFRAIGRILPTLRALRVGCIRTTLTGMHFLFLGWKGLGSRAILFE